MFVGDFNSKLEAFGCAKKNISGPMLKNIQSHLNLTYLNNDEHTHLDKRTGNTDILDMAFISPNLTKHDIQFLIGDDLGSDHLAIEISINAQPHRNIHTNPTRYKFNQTDRVVFESTLEAALSLGDVPELNSTQDIDKYADCIVTAISTAVDKAIPTSKRGRPESQPVLEESLALIKEKRRLRRQFSHVHHLPEVRQRTCLYAASTAWQETIRYAEVSGSGDASLLCSSYHDPLSTWPYLTLGHGMPTENFP